MTRPNPTTRRAHLVLLAALLGGCAAPLHLDEARYRGHAYASPGQSPGVPDAPKRVLDATPMQGLTVSQARDLALLRNHTVQAAAAAVEAARARIAAARSAFLPTLTGTIQRTHFREATEVEIPGVATFVLSPFWQTTGSAALTQSLFAFGRDWEAVKAARADLTTQVLDERVVKQRLLFEVTQAWYRLHEAEAQVAVSRDQLKASERQLADAENVVRAGRATKDSELTAKVEVFRSRQDLLVATNAVTHSRRVLNALLVRELDAETTIAEAPEFQPVKLDGKALFALAREHNPSILQFRSGRLALEHRRESIIRSFAPEIVGTLGATYNNFTLATGFSTNYTATIAAQWTPVNGGRRIGQLAEIHAGLAQLREQELQALQDLELGIERTILDVGESESAVELARQSVEASTENYRIVSDRFRNGKVTTRELLEAQTTLSNSRFALNQARFGHLTLLASLEAQIGVRSEDWLPKSEGGKR